MNLNQQLRELRVNFLRDTSDITPDGVDDRLYPDTTLLAYIQEAETKFCRLTDLLVDNFTKSVTQVTLREGVASYRLHSSVQTVQSVKYNTNVTNLRLTSNHELFRDGRLDGDVDFEALSDDTLLRGDPKVYLMDQSSFNSGGFHSVLSVYPVPGANQNDKKLYLRVTRAPLCSYTLNDLERESELPIDYQISVLHWAAVRALSGFDGDKGSATVLKAHKDAWDELIKEVKNQVRLKMHERPVRFRHGGGFSWDSV